ncbi:unnamed protein product [Ambrosiozyma monospora]|uniref:Unnamed protein product n=1 Tax=Ambrosiozyma monospora TaxID=43982 RepID=A0ACB5T973_AMBMO|nr:unnamed protein product [Ambrosiozyma monospora]
MREQVNGTTIDSFCPESAGSDGNGTVVENEHDLPVEQDDHEHMEKTYESDCDGTVGEQKKELWGLNTVKQKLHNNFSKFAEQCLVEDMNNDDDNVVSPPHSTIPTLDDGFYRLAEPPLHLALARAPAPAQVPVPAPTLSSNPAPASNPSQNPVTENYACTPTFSLKEADLSDELAEAQLFFSAVSNICEANQKSVIGNPSESQYQSPKIKQYANKQNIGTKMHCHQPSTA